jgi:hypothetical protein
MSACGAVPRQVVADSRVTIVSPAELAIVQTPVELRWTTSGSAAGTRYAVFVDVRPMRPDQSLRALVPSGDPCRRIPGCPDVSWLAARGIFITSADHVEIPALPTLGGVVGAMNPVVHQVSVVPIDGSGHRIGERIYTVDLRAFAAPVST